jgi:hypothetical protein
VKLNHVGTGLGILIFLVIVAFCAVGAYGWGYTS